MPKGVYPHKPLSGEAKRNLSEKLKGRSKPPFSEEHKRKISESQKGEHRSPDTEFKKGRKSTKKGKTYEETYGEEKAREIKKKISENHADLSGDKHPLFGKRWKMSEETKRKISLANGGMGVSQVTSKRYYHLRDSKYKEWRSDVFERDNWTCQTCGARSRAGESVYLEPHHIRGWAKYPKLRYDVENGVTLCVECHRLTRKKH